MVAMANQLNALSVPDVGDECVAFGKPPIEFLGSEDSVVDFAAEGLFGFADFGGELPLIGPPEDQNVNVAGSIGFLFRKRPVNPRRLDAGNCLKRVPQSWLDADRALEKGKDELEVRIGGIDAVVALAAFGFRAQETLLLKPGEFAGCVGGVGANCRG